MKTTIALFLLSAVSSTNILSITASSSNADELNFNLRHTANIKLLEGAQNKHQCYNHCERHTGKSKQWIDDCEEKCDRQYDPSEEPSPTPAPHEPRGKNICTRSPDYECYMTGHPACCSSDEYECPDYMTMCDNHGEGMSGTSFCTYAPQFGCDPKTWSNIGYPKCCDAPGGDIMNCPIEQPPCNADETPAPTPAPSELQCYNHGDECETDDDCLTGGFNPCNKCGTEHGTKYYQRCYSEPVETPAPTPADEDVVLIESDEDRDKVNWDKAGNWTRKAADTVADGTKKAAQKTAEGTKKAAEATKDWGKRTFTDDNSGYSATSSMVVVAAVATFMLV